jgi:hypothetical protein
MTLGSETGGSRTVQPRWPADRPSSRRVVSDWQASQPPTAGPATPQRSRNTCSTGAPHSAVWAPSTAACIGASGRRSPARNAWGWKPLVALRRGCITHGYPHAVQGCAVAAEFGQGRTKGPRLAWTCGRPAASGGWSGPDESARQRHGSASLGGIRAWRPQTLLGPAGHASAGRRTFHAPTPKEDVFDRRPAQRAVGTDHGCVHRRVRNLLAGPEGVGMETAGGST